MESSSDPKWEEMLGVADRLALEWRRDIRERGLLPHDRFASESELSRRSGVNLTTIRRVLARLEAEGVIYRLHGRGTFVAPSRKPFRLLLVPPEADPGDFVPFYYYLLSASPSDTEVLCHPPGVGLPSVRDVRFLHPGLRGLVFFRSLDPLEACRHEYRGGGLRCLYVGPDRHVSRVFHGLFHEGEGPLGAADAAFAARKALEGLRETGEGAWLRRLEDEKAASEAPDPPPRESPQPPASPGAVLSREDNAR